MSPMKMPGQHSMTCQRCQPNMTYGDCVPLTWQPHKDKAASSQLVYNAHDDDHDTTSYSYSYYHKNKMLMLTSTTCRLQIGVCKSPAQYVAIEVYVGYQHGS
jgi:hypothetical protein